MTIKQLYKRLSFIQNKFISTKLGSFDLTYFNPKDGKEFFSLYIISGSGKVIFHDYYALDYKDLNDRLQKLKKFVDELLDC